MQKKEAEFTTKLQKWARHFWPQDLRSGPIEVKVSYKPLFNYKSGIKKHQLPILLSTTNTTFIYKISDFDRLDKPFDLVLYKQATPTFVFHWVRPKNKTFYIVSPYAILTEIEKGVKSLSEERCEQICHTKAELA